MFVKAEKVRREISFSAGPVEEAFKRAVLMVSQQPILLAVRADQREFTAFDRVECSGFPGKSSLGSRNVATVWSSSAGCTWFGVSKRCPCGSQSLYIAICWCGYFHGFFRCSQ